MAIDINATLVVQSFNIFVAYVLLRKLFFKPAIQVLQREEKEKEHLKSLVAQREDLLAKTEEQKRLAWQESRALFSQAAPPVRRAGVVPPYVGPTERPAMLTSDQTETLIQDVQRVILKKVKNVNE